MTRRIRFPRFGSTPEPEDQRLFLRMDAPQHTIFRDLLAKNFTLSAMKRMRPAIQELVDETIDTMLANPDRKADFVESLALPIPSTVLSWLLGYVPKTEPFQLRRRSCACGHRSHQPGRLDIAMTAMHEPARTFDPSRKSVLRWMIQVTTSWVNSSVQHAPAKSR